MHDRPTALDSVPISSLILMLPQLFPTPTSPRHPWFVPKPQAWLDSLQLWNFFPMESLPAVEWEEAPPRPGCILTLDSRYSPEGVQAVEAAVARLLRELGVAAEEVGEGERVGDVRGGKGIGGEGIRGEGAGEWEGRLHGGLRGRRLKGEEEGTGEREGEGGLNGEGKKAERGKGEGDGEGNVEGKDEGKGEGKDEDDDSKVKEEGGGRGGEAMPEAWGRLYEALPKVVDAEGHENMWKFPIWVVRAAPRVPDGDGERIQVHSGSTSIMVQGAVATGAAGVLLRVGFLPRLRCLHAHAPPHPLHPRLGPSHQAPCEF
ncbi:unnamed protein product [Closterium sp. Yama58-4]|nr:unnamed protein product [Closterium sp. Yama58-4]